MFGFIPLMIIKSGRFKESLVDSIKQLNVTLYYFLVQVVGRLLFAWSCLLGWGLLGVIGLAIKTGIPPFFWWVPVLISRLDWYSIILISRIQKIAPLVLMRRIFDYRISFCLIIALSRMIFRVVGINYSSKDIKMVMGWSSVGKMGLIFFLMGGWLNLGTIYFLLYVVSVIIIGLSFNTDDKGKFSVKKDVLDKLKILLSSRFLILVFSGLPPFLGFISKVYLFSGLSLTECIICIKESMLFCNFGIEYMISYPYSDILGGWIIGVFFSFLLMIQVIGYIKVFVKIYISYCFGLINTRLKKKRFRLEYCLFILFFSSFAINSIT